MSIEIKKEVQLEIAHVLFIDVVGYSKLSINDQHAAVEELNQMRCPLRASASRIRNSLWTTWCLEIICDNDNRPLKFQCR